MAKILCVLYDDPIGGYPKSYARDGIPKIDRYPGGQSAPTPEHIDFKPGELLGSVSSPNSWKWEIYRPGVLDRAIFRPFSH